MRKEAFGRAAVCGALALSMSGVLHGCSTASAVQIAGAAVGAALDAAGIDVPGVGRSAGVRQPIALSASESLNLSAEGEPLSLVVRIYQLRSDASFATLGYAQAGQAGEERTVLADDLIAVRELVLLPGTAYRLDEPVDAAANYIGVVALFRMPAADGWKLAFERKASAGSGIALGLHACGMTVDAGVLTARSASGVLRSLGAPRCRQGERYSRR